MDQVTPVILRATFDPPHHICARTLTHLDAYMSGYESWRAQTGLPRLFDPISRLFPLWFVSRCQTPQPLVHSLNGLAWLCLESVARLECTDEVDALSRYLEMRQEIIEFMHQPEHLDQHTGAHALETESSSQHTISEDSPYNIAAPPIPASLDEWIYCICKQPAIYLTNHYDLVCVHAWLNGYCWSFRDAEGTASADEHRIADFGEWICSLYGHEYARNWSRFISILSIDRAEESINTFASLWAKFNSGVQPTQELVGKDSQIVSAILRRARSGGTSSDE